CLPNDKSFGPDCFNNEFLEKCWPIIEGDFNRLCWDFQANNVCLRSINSSHITLLPKKEGALKVGDFRPISLLNSSVKLLTKLLANHLQKKEIVVLKLDFEKAFDKIEHQAMLDIMKAKGFGSVWLTWMQDILSSSTSSVLLNRIPGKTIHCRRGVRQGDPLSPLFFVLAADLLQSILNRAKDQGILRLPIPCSFDNDYPIIQYVDDTLIILEGDGRQLFALKFLLNSFATSIGLKQVLHVPYQHAEERIDTLAQTFGCSKGVFPFTYLDLPLGLTRPKIEDFQPLIKYLYLSISCGNTPMVNVVFTSLPTFFICQSSNNLTNSENFISKGALIFMLIVDQRKRGLCCACQSQKVVSVSPTEEPSQILQSLRHPLGKLNMGKTLQQWLAARDRAISVNQGWHIDLLDVFHLPMSEEAFEQLQAFYDDLQELTLDHDRWSYIWNSNNFTSSKAYKHMTGHRPTHPAFKWLWKSCCLKKHKVFFWLLLKDRLNTRNLLRRKSMVLPSYNCVFCGDSVEETFHHLFIECPFCQDCWQQLHLVFDPSEEHMEIFNSLKVQLNVPFFMKIIVLQCWAIWNERNNFIFRGIPPSSSHCHTFFKSCFE
ncbi:hypothetical protein U9M48_002834, partial [Paspalum notatum var. saurae]